MVEEEYLGIDLESVEVLGGAAFRQWLTSLTGLSDGHSFVTGKAIIRDGWLGEGTCGGCRHRSPDDSGVPRSGI